MQYVSLPPTFIAALTPAAPAKHTVGQRQWPNVRANCLLSGRPKRWPLLSWVCMASNELNLVCTVTTKLPAQVTVCMHSQLSSFSLPFSNSYPLLTLSILAGSVTRGWGLNDWWTSAIEWLYHIYYYSVHSQRWLYKAVKTKSAICLFNANNFLECPSTPPIKTHSGL